MAIETIKKGEQKCKPHFKPYFGLEVVKFEFMLADSAFHFYPSGDIFAGDIHKIAGVSFGNQNYDSIRLGFKNNVKTKSTDLYYHLNNKGLVMFNKIGNVRPWQYYSATIHHHYKEKYFDLYVEEKEAKKSILVENHKVVDIIEVPFIYPPIHIGNYLFPSWGPHHKAPKDVNIKLKFI